MGIRIPFNRPCLSGNEYKYIAEAISNGHASGDGPFTRRCHQLLEQEMRVPKALLTTSCTHALEMAAMLLECGPGDEIIVPSFTFVSTANAFALRGAKVVFADVRPDTLNLDETRLASLITKHTKALVPVHYGGVACDMDSLCAIAQQYEIKVVEDNAHGLFARYKEKFTGTFGCLSTQSFHETKNISCGEGGALLVNDPALVERAMIIREKGTNRAQFFRGQVDKYTWVDFGSSYLPSDILAAFLLAQLESREEIRNKRRRVWNYYFTNLQVLARENGIQLPFIPENCEQSYHLFYLILPSLECRQALITHLKEHGILSVFHYVPLHLSAMGLKFGSRECPVAENISDRLLRLPFYNDLSEADQEHIVTAIMEFFRK